VFNFEPTVPEHYGSHAVSHPAREVSIRLTVAEFMPLLVRSAGTPHCGCIRRSIDVRHRGQYHLLRLAATLHLPSTAAAHCDMATWHSPHLAWHARALTTCTPQGP